MEEDSYTFPENPFLNEENKENMAHISQLANNGSELHRDLFACLEKLQKLVEATITEANEKQETYARTSQEVDDLQQQLQDSEKALEKSEDLRRKHEQALEELYSSEQAPDAADKIIQQAERLLVNGYQMQYTALHQALHHEQPHYSALTRRCATEKMVWEEERNFAEAEINRVSEALTKLLGISSQNEKQLLKATQDIFSTDEEDEENADTSH
jgi:DNA polymerase III gamma/tau subunit